MVRRRILVLSLLLCAPSWHGWVTAGCEEASAQMVTPPPVSSASYPVEIGAEKRSNYLQLGITFGASYINNLYAGTTPKPLQETTFSILPTITFDQTRSIQHFRFSYYPGFTFYTPTNSLNEIDQSASVTYRRRLSVHATLRLDDDFEDSSTSFGPGYAGIGGATSGGSLVTPPGVIPPFAQRLTNSSRAQWTLQTGTASMIGFEGIGSVLNYPNPGQTVGLFNTNMRGGSAFLSRLITHHQYLGGKYSYTYSVADVPQSSVDVQTHVFAGFYTYYFSRDWSLSFMGGPEYYKEHQTQSFNNGAWTPSVSARLERQGQYSTYAVGYSQLVAGGGGIAGAYYSKTADASAQVQLTRRTIAGLRGSYADNRAVAPLQSVISENGHSITGSVYARYNVSDHLYLMCDYQRIHESYAQILSIHNNPDSGRVAASITWQATRPFGR